MERRLNDEAVVKRRRTWARLRAEVEAMHGRFADGGGGAAGGGAVERRRQRRFLRRVDAEIERIGEMVEERRRKWELAKDTPP